MGASIPHTRDSPTAISLLFPFVQKHIWSSAVSDTSPEGRSPSSPISKALHLFCNCSISLLWMQNFRALEEHSRIVQKISNKLNERTLSLNTCFVKKKKKKTWYMYIRSSKDKSIYSIRRQNICSFQEHAQISPSEWLCKNSNIIFPHLTKFSPIIFNMCAG